MRKFARFSLVVALLGLPIGLVTTGCSDNAGGNEDEGVNKTKGTVTADDPQTPEDYMKKRSPGKK